MLGTGSRPAARPGSQPCSRWAIRSDSSGLAPTARSSRAGTSQSPTDEDFTDLACTGLDDERRHVDDYRAQLEALADRDVLIHCLNPDRVVDSRRGAGALRGRLGRRLSRRSAAASNGTASRFPGDLSTRAQPRRQSAAPTRCSRSATRFRPTCWARHTWASTRSSLPAESTPARRFRPISARKTALATGNPWRSSTPFAKALPCNCSDKTSGSISPSSSSPARASSKARICSFARPRR